MDSGDGRVRISVATQAQVVRRKSLIGVFAGDVTEAKAPAGSTLNANPGSRLGEPPQGPDDDCPIPLGRVEAASLVPTIRSWQMVRGPVRRQVAP
jgi:hypothetical protein